MKRRHFECYLARFAFQNETDCTLQFSQMISLIKINNESFGDILSTTWWSRQIGRAQIGILIQIWQSERANFSEKLRNSACSWLHLYEYIKIHGAQNVKTAFIFTPNTALKTLCIHLSFTACFGCLCQPSSVGCTTAEMEVYAKVEVSPLQLKH